jgi:multisubunit Na+/H+ antiporter MnhB subunit
MTMGAEYLREAPQTGAHNRVTAVLLDFRAYDTLGEATVIFTAILGCYALLRTRGMKEGGPELHSEAGQ